MDALDEDVQALFDREGVDGLNQLYDQFCLLAGEHEIACRHGEVPVQVEWTYPGPNDILCQCLLEESC